jgi:hypothetical protein
VRPRATHHGPSPRPVTREGGPPTPDPGTAPLTSCSRRSDPAVLAQPIKRRGGHHDVTTLTQRSAKHAGRTDASAEPWGAVWSFRRWKHHWGEGWTFPAGSQEVRPDPGRAWGRVPPDHGRRAAAFEAIGSTARRSPGAAAGADRDGAGSWLSNARPPRHVTWPCSAGLVAGRRAGEVRPPHLASASRGSRSRYKFTLWERVRETSRALEHLFVQHGPPLLKRQLDPISTRSMRCWPDTWSCR